MSSYMSVRKSNPDDAETTKKDDKFLGVMSKPAAFGAMGAVAGALTAPNFITKKKKFKTRNMLIGATIGGVVGYSIGRMSS